MSRSLGGSLSTQMRIEPAVALMDLDRVVSEGDEFQVIAGTANAHLAEAGLGPRLAPCVVARLEADAPKASRVRAFGPSQYASSAVCRLTPVEEALAAELDERAAKVFQRGDGEGFRDDDQWAKHALRAHLRDVLDRLAACPLVPGPEEGDVVADREFAGDLARRHGGPFVAAFLDTAPAVRFLAQRNPALADWLAVADAPTLARPDPSLADRIGLRAHAREATGDLTVDDALASGQKVLTNVAAQLTNVVGSRAPAAGAFRGGDAAAAAAGVGPDVAPAGAAAPPRCPADAHGRPARRRVRKSERGASSLWRDRRRHHGEGGRSGCRRLGSGRGARTQSRLWRGPRRPCSAPRAVGRRGASAAPGDGRSAGVHALCDTTSSRPFQIAAWSDPCVASMTFPKGQKSPPEPQGLALPR